MTLSRGFIEFFLRFFRPLYLSPPIRFALFFIFPAPISYSAHSLLSAARFIITLVNKSSNPLTLISGTIEKKKGKNRHGMRLRFYAVLLLLLLLLLPLLFSSRSYNWRVYILQINSLNPKILILNSRLFGVKIAISSLVYDRMIN